MPLCDAVLINEYIQTIFIPRFYYYSFFITKMCCLLFKKSGFVRARMYEKNINNNKKIIYGKNFSIVVVENKTKKNVLSKIHLHFCDIERHQLEAINIISNMINLFLTKINWRYVLIRSDHKENIWLFRHDRTITRSWMSERTWKEESFKK